MLVTDGIQRASLRDRFETRQLLGPGEVYKLDVDLWSTSLILNRGHRLRIAISSSNLPSGSPAFRS
jgi:predicted acyl esterase